MHPPLRHRSLVMSLQLKLGLPHPALRHMGALDIFVDMIKLPFTSLPPPAPPTTCMYDLRSPRCALNDRHASMVLNVSQLVFTLIRHCCDRNAENELYTAMQPQNFEVFVRHLARTQL